MSSEAQPQYVVDASIVVKWYLKDEELVPEAETLFAAYGNGQVDLIAPQHIQYEVAHVLRTGGRRNRISEAEARQALTEFLSLDILFVAGIDLVLRAWQSSLHYGCALYDSLYVALAEITDARFVHADRRLHNTLSGNFDLETWIENLPSI